MSLKEFAGTLPDFAKDIRLNVGSLLNETVLDPQKKFGTMLACAHATGHKPLVEAAAAVMAMNNVYYRFVHLAKNKEYGNLPAKLRMNVIAAPGIEKVDFELFSLAVSAINGCGMCIDAHEDVLKKHGVKAEVIQGAVRIGAVLAAVATVHAAVA